MNPLNLPSKTIRCKFKSGYTPHMGISQTRVEGSTNVWDIAFDNMVGLFDTNTYIEEVLGANTKGVTNMQQTFFGCSYLTSVAFFDMSSVTNMSFMFYSCTRLQNIPSFDISSVTQMNKMVQNCVKVDNGALALYQQASAKNPQPEHTDTFTLCGRDSVTGAAEVAQIPASWGGTAT